MSEAVLDASIVCHWFRPTAGGEAANALKEEFLSGSLAVMAPRLLDLEVLNTFGRRLGWPAHQLRTLAGALELFDFTYLEPRPTAVAAWVGAGLTAYDSAYVALGQELGLPVVTYDRLILETAPAIAVAPELGAGASASAPRGRRPAPVRSPRQRSPRAPGRASR